MKRILTTILFVVFFINPLSAQELAGTLQQIQKSGKIKVGYRLSQPPMSFLDKNGVPAGYSIDLCKNIVTEINKKIGTDIVVEYVPVTAEERFHALADKKIDILCGATTKTLSRSELVDFTQLTFITGASFMTLKGMRIKGNFAGKNIGVVKGTTTAMELKELFKETQIDANIIPLNTIPGKFSILPDLFSYEPLALAVRRNDADFRLIADRVISNLYRSKQILTIYDKWFSKFSRVRPTAFETLVQFNAIPK